MNRLRRWTLILILSAAVGVLAGCSSNEAKTGPGTGTVQTSGAPDGSNSGTAEASVSESNVPQETDPTPTNPTATPTPFPDYASGTELFGMISVTGKIVIQPKYEYLDLFTEDGLARFCHHGFWGYVNKIGVEVVKPQYEDAMPFSNGLAAVKSGGLYGFINTSGEMVIAPAFEAIEGGFIYDRCVFEKDGKKGLMDSAGNVIFEPLYADFTLCCDKYLVVTDERGLYAVYDCDGNVVLDFQAREIADVAPEGYILFVKSSIFNLFTGTELNGKMKYTVDDTVRYYSSYYKGSDAISYSEDAVLWGLMDLATGEDLVTPAYDSVYIIRSDLSRAIMYKDGLGGILSTVTGETIVPCSYPYIITEDDFYIVRMSGDQDAYESGVLNYDGALILKPVYSHWLTFSGDGEVAAMAKDGRTIVVDSAGKTVFETSSGVVISYFIDESNGWLFSDGDDDTQGLLDRKGNIVIEDKYKFMLIESHAIFYGDPEHYAYFVNSDYQFVKAGPYTDMIDCTSQGDVLVVIDASGKYGMITSDGTELYPLSDCGIYTNGIQRRINMDDYDYTDYVVNYANERDNTTAYMQISVKAG